MFLPSSKRAWLSPLLTLRLVASTASAFKVAISDADELRQTCSGMWAGKDTSIDLTFKPNSTGSVATIFYEWQDFPLLGTPTSQRDVFGEPVLTYICTPTAVNQKICKEEDVGNFILSDAARAKTVRRERVDLKGDEKVLNYVVNQTGYYCVGATAVPLTADSQHAKFDALITFHNMFKGELPGGEYPKLGFYFGLTCTYILLGAAWAYLCVKHKDELLTIQHFISGLFLILVIEQLITYAYYRYLNTHSIDFFHLSSVSGNASETWSARALLVIESIIDSARNSASFFLLLIVSMGYGLVRPRLDPKVMLRAKLLTAVHLVCGCLYSVGIVLLSIEAGGTWVFLFIFPLAFTLTSLMMWSLNSLNATISHLTARKQTFKLAYFKRLYRILVGAVVVTGAFFVVSSVAFSQSGAESFPSQTWRYRWFLLDGWTSLLYLAVFGLIAWTWRPTGMNLRLSMSDEIATGEMEGDAEDIEMGGEYAGPGMPGEDSDDEDDEEAAKRKRKSAAAASNASGAQPSSSSGSGSASGGMGPPPAYEPRQSASASANDDVVFALGDEDEEGEDEAGALRKQGGGRKSNASEETIRER
ncbi:hypothetical protein BDZ90DRAFT_260665 [Jaminaea rosea]|uniref:PTM1-member of the major facilitator superfamily n=1 Tax=Jaminaea rosea TaxID=1569628 RepID=A0A316UV49_9BASI|nr:hypothetical protein BDZ90DRAFT_260665 [Jaminaea rosea]PWN26985.1 hypothetical protein BDZ90DRAFT_260665 [Jaminaea rosea]